LILFHEIKLVFLSVFVNVVNGLQICDVADLEAQKFNLAQMFISTPKLDSSTELAIFPNCC
jgi:hypothetical protein